MGGSFGVDIAFGICIEDANEARWAAEGLDALTVNQEIVEGIPRCSFADSRDSFITLMPSQNTFLANQLDVSFDSLDAIMKDERKMAQWKTCLERLDVPYVAPRVYPVLWISP